MKIGVKVSDAMTKNPVVVNSNASISECARIMYENNVGSLIVKERDLLGIITEEDIVKKVVSKKLDIEKTTAKNIMESNLFTISGREDIYEALILMKEKKIRHLPVVQNGELIGFLTIKDILKIQPGLSEMVVENFDLKEEDKKSEFFRKKIEGECETCGNFLNLFYFNSKWVCNECLEN
jgi:signal-transduction protein with cAMP-binding, CBS, and nucleotidyltransferase domain